MQESYSIEILQKIKRLTQELESIKQQRSSFNKEAREWAEKRNSIHKQIKDLRLEAKNTRERRDAINMEVKTLKTKRDQTKAVVKEQIEEIKRLREKLRLLETKKPKQGFEKLKKEKDEIEWKIQTSSLTLREEKPLVDRANQLEADLDVYQRIGSIEGKIMTMQNKIRAMNEEAKLFHTQLSEIAEQSQQLHNRMIETLNKVKTLHSEADGYHLSFLSCRQKAQGMHEKCVELERQIQKLREELMAKEGKEKELMREEARKKLKSEALKKLKHGEKLTFEEFKLTSDEET